MQTTPTLKLDYAFVSDPNPIRASAAGANPNTIDLQVIISNPQPFGVKVNKIEIQIPVGSNSARDLTAAPSLPPATGYPTDVWQIALPSGGGDTMTITAAGGGSFEFGGSPLIFTLPQIQVNITEGTVPVTITEYYPAPAPKVIDGTTYKLLKREADFPITKFWVEPDTLDDLEQTVTLRWDCSQQGQNYSYGLCSDVPGLQLNGCVADGNCYTCSDGSSGVETPPLAPPQGPPGVNFYLDIVETDSAGNRKVHATLAAPVRVAVPYISGNSKLIQSPSGHLVRLNWLAHNASRCTITLNDDVIDDNAPVNTYEQGYMLYLPDDSEKYQLVVTAHAQSGLATYSHTFPNVIPKPPQTINVGVAPFRIAITPDGKLAFVTNMNQSSFTVSVIDLPTLKLKSTITVGGAPSDIAITPDGKLAFVTNQWAGTVSVIDVSTLTVRSTITVGATPLGIAITPDGKLAFVTNFGNGTMSVIDVSTLTVRSTIPGGVFGIAITPDGTLAFVTNMNPTVSVIDVPTLTLKSTITLGGVQSFGIAITPDGKLAFVTNKNSGTPGPTVSVIDVPTLTLKSTISEGGFNSGPIAITPDGRLALVLNALMGNAATVSVIDVPTLTLKSTIPMGGGEPAGIAITSKGNTLMALVANQRNNNVTVI